MDMKTAITTSDEGRGYQVGDIIKVYGDRWGVVTEIISKDPYACNFNVRWLNWHQLLILRVKGWWAAALDNMSGALEEMWKAKYGSEDEDEAERFRIEYLTNKARTLDKIDRLRNCDEGMEVTLYSDNPEFGVGPDYVVTSINHLDAEPRKFFFFGHTMDECLDKAIKYRESQSALLRQSPKVR